MLELVILSGKGGVGKSTLAASLINYLSKSGYKVVAVDADADAPNLHILLGVKEWSSVREFTGYVASIDRSKCLKCGKCYKVCHVGAVEVINGDYVINELLCDGCYACLVACPNSAISRVKTRYGVVRVGVSSYGNYLVISPRLDPGKSSSGRLVTEVKSVARSLGGDAIYVVDSAAGIGCQVISSVVGASAAILITEPTPTGFHDLIRAHKLVKHFMLPSALVINKYDLNEELSREIIRYAEEENIDYLGSIPYDEKVIKSLNEGRLITEAYPNSSASKAILNICNKVVTEVIESWDNWFRRYRPKRYEPFKVEIIR